MCKGTLIDWFLPPSAANGVVYAKTGTLNPAVGLSGYVQTAADPTVVARFAYMLNGELIGITEGVRTLPDDFIAALTACPEAPPVAEFALGRRSRQAERVAPASAVPSSSSSPRWCCRSTCSSPATGS